MRCPASAEGIERTVQLKLFNRHFEIVCVLLMRRVLYYKRAGRVNHWADELPSTPMTKTILGEMRQT